MPQTKLNDDLYVVVISSLEEQNQLHNLCVSRNIPILYPDLFKEDVHHIWGISRTGVGLAGTVIARYTPKNHILHSIDELTRYLDSLYN